MAHQIRGRSLHCWLADVVLSYLSCGSLHLHRRLFVDRVLDAILGGEHESPDLPLLERHRV